MTTKPFSEGLNPADVISITYVSNSIDTSGVDPYRQGVELTQEKYFQQGIAKIWSGNSGHGIEMRNAGENVYRIYPESTAFTEVAKFDPVASVRSDLSNEVIVVDTAVETNETSLDGIIEPLTIRRVITFTSTDVPFEAHSVRGNIESGNYNPHRNADQILSRFKFAGHITGSYPYEDNVDMMGNTPTNLGYWPMPPVLEPGFDDSQVKDGVIVPDNADDLFIENLKAMDPPTGNYLATGYISSAAVLNDYDDWIHPIANIEAPILSILNYSQGDVGGGGESIVILGWNFRNVTDVTFGGTSATSFQVNSPTRITAVLPAHAAGSVDVYVLNSAGTSNSLSFEYWSPASLSPLLWARAPNYSAGPGTFTDEGSLGENFTEATNYPAEGSAIGNYSPSPDFDGTNDKLQNSSTMATMFPSGILFWWCLFNADAVDAYPISYDGNLMADVTGAEVGIDINTSGFSATVLNSGLSYARSGTLTCSTGEWHLGLLMVDPSDTGAEGKIAVDDSGWSTWEVTGGYTDSAPGPITLGRGYETRFFNGRMAEVGAINAVVTDSNVIKLRKYMNQRYGVSV